MDNGYPTVSVVNAVGSLIARTTKMGVYLNAGRENAVASTKPSHRPWRLSRSKSPSQALIALWFREKKESLGLTSSKDHRTTQELRDTAD